MKSESFDGSREREVLASLIWDDTVLAAVIVSYRQSPLLFRSDLTNYVLKWVVGYYEKYNKAPGDDIKQLPAEVLERDEAMAERLTGLIESLTPPTSANSTRLIDIAAAYFEKVQVERFVDTLSSKITRDDTQGCIDSINTFSRITTGVTRGVNPLVDEGALKAAFADNTVASLLTFNNEDSRQFFGDTFSRSSFVVINAGEKCGKSQCLLELALMAVYQGRKVAYFEAGDMSQAQVFRRIYQRIAKHPRRAGTIRVPTALTVVDDDYGKDVQLQLQYKYLAYQEDMNEEIALAACKKWQTDLGANGVNWKFSAHPQNLTVPLMCSILDEWERVDNFIPDFVVVDYADILLSASRNNEYRHQINDTFARLRGVSLDRKCCLLTATQANADAWDAAVLTRQNLSEDKRKAAHPTAIIGLNASHYEREQQVAKLNYLVRRDDVCNEYDCLYIAQALPICSPMVKTYFPAIHKNDRKAVTPAPISGMSESEKEAAENSLDAYSSGRFSEPAAMDRRRR